MPGPISLSTAARTNLLSLQNTSSLIAMTQNRLATGKAVNAPTDDAVKYFQARALSSRAKDLGDRKDAMDQGVSSLDATLQATGSMEKLLQNMKGKIEALGSQSTSERSESQKQLIELVKQTQKLIDDASYKGLNLLNSTGSSLSVRFSEKVDAKIDIAGVDLRTSKTLFRKSDGTTGIAIKATGTGLNAVSQLGFTQALTAYTTSKASIAAVFVCRSRVAGLRIEQSISNLRSKAATMATSSDILKIRMDFTAEYSNVLQAGSDKLTLADLNNEGANMMALQTRQQLGVQALSLAGQSEQQVLSLLRG